MSIENKWQFNQAINTALERNKSGKIEWWLVKTTVSKLTSMVNNATVVDKKDSNVVKQSKEKLAKDKNFHQDIYNFVLRSALSKWTKWTEEYHASKFDKDQTKGLSEYEMNQWVDQLNGWIIKILQHGSISKFQSTESDIKSDIEESKFNPQYYLNGFQLGDVASESFTNVTWEQAQKLLEAKRWDQNFIKWLGFAVLKEWTQSIQDILVFFADILAVVASWWYVLTQYGYYRTKCELSNNPEYKAKMDAMAENHPLLWIANMLTTNDGWSKLSELISSFGDPKQLTAQKITIGITTIVWLIWWGVGLAKWLASITSKFASKLYKLEKYTKTMVKVRKVSMDTNKISRKTWKVVEVMDKVFDPLWNATSKWLWVVAGKVNNIDDYLSQKEAVDARAQRLLSQKDKRIWQNNEQLEKELLDAAQNHFDTMTTEEWNGYSATLSGGHPDHLVHKNLGVNKYWKTVVFTDAPLSEKNKSRVAAHEAGHYYRNTFDEWADRNSFFDFSGVESATYLRWKWYLRWKGVWWIVGDEIRERAAQLKDYIAHKYSIPLNQNFVITKKQFDDALKNYVKDIWLDNNMTNFIKSIKDKKGLLLAMNKYALSMTPIYLYLQSEIMGNPD